MKTIAEVKALNPERIYYSANTVFWTHDPKDLQKAPSGLPLDCFGSPLLQTNGKSGVDEFLNESAIKTHPAYGKEENRERNFMMAHARNIGIVCKKMPPKSFAIVGNFEPFAKFCDGQEGLSL